MLHGSCQACHSLQAAGLVDDHETYQNGRESEMKSNKNKGVLIFGLLYTILFVFDGIRVFDSPLPSSAGTYFAYTIMFVYGCFLI